MSVIERKWAAGQDPAVQVLGVEIHFPTGTCGRGKVVKAVAMAEVTVEAMDTQSLDTCKRNNSYFR